MARYPWPAGSCSLDGCANNDVGLVIIGRNEGERLRRCLQSTRDMPHRLYVDSGSTDQSVEIAQREGVLIIELQSPLPFTAARARNAGLNRLLAHYPQLQFVQTIDGDCELQPGWIETGLMALQADPRLAVVFGRRRERHPERSVYNALCDDEWNIPIGEAAACGGDAMFRLDALRAVSFFNPFMIAGEDSELSMRLREAGWHLQRLAAEMTLHDAALLRFGQWWNRTRRSGHAFAEMAHLHPEARNPNWPRTVRSIIVWGGLLPILTLVAIVMSLCVDPLLWLVVALLLSPWPVKMAGLALSQRRRGLSRVLARASGVLLMFGKLPQFVGLIGYHWDRLADRRSTLIEYH